jgi:hypothetical protein
LKGHHGLLNQFFLYRSSLRLNNNLYLDVRVYHNYSDLFVLAVFGSNATINAPTCHSWKNVSCFDSGCYPLNVLVNYLHLDANVLTVE